MAILDVTNQTKVRVQPPVVASAAISSVETVIGGTANALPPNFLKAGQNMRITILGTCTSSVANASTWALRVGPLGTVADPVALTGANSVAAVSGTNIPFRCVYELTVRTVGAAGTLAGSFTLENTGVTGVSAVTVQTVAFTPTAVDTTATNFRKPTYVAAAASTACTFQNVMFELF